MAVLVSIVGLFGLAVTAAGVTLAYGVPGLVFVGFVITALLAAAVVGVQRRSRH